jgi:hypothetical protein
MNRRNFLLALAGLAGVITNSRENSLADDLKEVELEVRGMT